MNGSQTLKAADNMESGAFMEFLKIWIKEQWAKYNRQVLTFLETTVLIGLVAFFDSLYNSLTGSGMGMDWAAAMLLAGTTALSGMIQWIRGKLKSVPLGHEGED